MRLAIAPRSAAHTAKFSHEQGDLPFLMDSIRMLVAPSALRGLKQLALELLDLLGTIISLEVPQKSY